MLALILPWLLVGCASSGLQHPPPTSEVSVAVAAPDIASPAVGAHSAADAASSEPSNDAPTRIVPCRDEPDVEGEGRKKHRAFVRTMLARDVRVGKVRCMGGRELWRDPRGRLRVCTLAQPIRIAGIDIADGAYTHFHANGAPYQTTLAHAHVLKTAAGLAVSCAADSVTLSEVGALEYCDLARAMTIGAVACRASEGVAFHPSGKLLGAVIDRPLEALATTFKMGTRMQWHPAGAVRGGWLASAQRVAGYPVRSDFRAYPEGTLQSLELAEARTLAGHDFPPGSNIWLRRDGSVQRAHYVHRRGFLPHGEEWTDTLHLRFDCAGKQIDTRTEHWQAPHRPRKRRP